ncbi:MAG: universal stress protein [Gammaproteobacteria bacterium]|jgi:nucleotide-binding universal stress UspA family protein
MQRFRNILCVVEPGESSRYALERAVSLAENNQAALHVIDVIPHIIAGIGMPDGGPISRDLQDTLAGERLQRLEAQVDPYRKRVDLQLGVLQGTPFLEIIREVLRNGHDLVIKHPEDVDWLDRLFSSDDMHLLRKCPCPVWLIKPSATHPYRQILAAVDVDDAYPAEELQTRQALNRQVLEMAVSLALSEFAALHIVHAWEAVGEDSMRSAFLHAGEDRIGAYVELVRRHHEASLDALLREVTAALSNDAMNYLEPQSHLVKGAARREIPALARRIDADLVVMGTVARTGVPGLIMGNTAETILGQLDCSVLAVKPPGFRTPVSL